MLPIALEWGFYCFFIVFFCISIWQITNEICLVRLNCFVLLLSHTDTEDETMEKVICFFGQTQQYINIWSSWPVFEEIFYSLKGKELNSCMYHSIEILIMQEAIRIELQREMAQIIQCCQVTHAQNSLRSKQNELQVLVKKKKNEGSLELGMKSSCVSVHFQYHCFCWVMQIWHQ